MKFQRNYKNEKHPKFVPDPKNGFKNSLKNSLMTMRFMEQTGVMPTGTNRLLKKQKKKAAKLYWAIKSWETDEDLTTWVI